MGYRVDFNACTPAYFQAEPRKAAILTAFVSAFLTVMVVGIVAAAGGIRGINAISGWTTAAVAFVFTAATLRYFRKCAREHVVHLHQLMLGFHEYEPQEALNVASKLGPNINTRVNGRLAMQMASDGMVRSFVACNPEVNTQTDGERPPLSVLIGANTSLKELIEAHVKKVQDRGYSLLTEWGKGIHLNLPSTQLCFSPIQYAIRCNANVSFAEMLDHASKYFVGPLWYAFQDHLLSHLKSNREFRLLQLSIEHRFVPPLQRIEFTIECIGQGIAYESQLGVISDALKDPLFQSPTYLVDYSNQYENRNCYLPILKLFIESKKFDLNAVDAHGCTLMDYSVANFNVEAIYVLRAREVAFSPLDALDYRCVMTPDEGAQPPKDQLYFSLKLQPIPADWTNRYGVARRHLRSFTSTTSCHLLDRYEQEARPGLIPYFMEAAKGVEDIAKLIASYVSFR